MKAIALKLVAYFHSIVSCGATFWGNSTHSIQVINIQKKIIRIMAGVKKKSLL
jgi:hypothetical protein